MIEQFAVRVLIWEAPIPFGGKKGSTTITNQHAIEFALALGGVFDLVGAKLELVACWKANMGGAAPLHRQRPRRQGHGARPGARRRL